MAREERWKGSSWPDGQSSQGTSLITTTKDSYQVAFSHRIFHKLANKVQFQVQLNQQSNMGTCQLGKKHI